ncbi:MULTISPECIES: anhydro-N-acetylmuramic acid kinase [unclassified Leeuwenhoekiella]|uniref:anhydro-N-acetylmuramic acid kinase n=1 Tax=unclassified Leeuwenhoekiella TaxID=2615029 RepID=UPI000C4D20CB|nr:MULTISPECIES: anhydro-N-acetylmuramic acid kinase [unclassified Leeuwenhoekiella]MAW96438.1 anhydro-N-acetylmuramic acid kinase [Leeuwenhoekiella sp.]MBA81325.1 anhydro-N-acetylmuramic acid kinase [Leeuwenhoekiella sp.]|tara:strand:+ start:5220 stop:6296 length:1077 start_codon:yes stop_codon:yes gene_type:complete
MNATSYVLLGVMSGTSLDGVDLAYVEFIKKDFWSYRILKSTTVPYSKIWVERLEKAVALPAQALKLLDEEYTQYLGSIIRAFIDQKPAEQLDAVASHGHTILHRPEAGLTYQIGNLPQLAGLIDKLVVCDFRVEDVALGGQGAPLVPVGDALLFKEYAACLNIGGFANISYDDGNKRIAYDICPTNIVLNTYARELGLDFDKDGELARGGRINEKVLDQLNALDYYTRPTPKSLGLEWVQEQIFPIMENSDLDAQDCIATFTEHMAAQIARNLRLSVAGKNSKNILITGGGAYNTYLIERISSLSDLALNIPDAQTIEFKEALIFAFMGALRLRNTPNVLSCVTGAPQDHCAGMVYSP